MNKCCDCARAGWTFSGCCCFFCVCGGRLGPSIRLSILERFFHLFQHQGSHQSWEREALKATFWTLLPNLTTHNEFLSRSCPHEKKKKKNSRHLYFCWRRKKIMCHLKAKSFFLSFLLKKKHLVGKATDLRNKRWGMCEFLFFFHSFFLHSATSAAQQRETREPGTFFPRVTRFSRSWSLFRGETCWHFIDPSKLRKLVLCPLRLTCRLKCCLEMDFFTLAPIIFIFTFPNLLTTVEFLIYFITRVCFHTLSSKKVEHGSKYVQVKARLKQARDYSVETDRKYANAHGTSNRWEI